MDNENISDIPTDPVTGEVLWSDEAKAWFERWGVEED